MRSYSQETYHEARRAYQRARYMALRAGQSVSYANEAGRMAYAAVVAAARGPSRSETKAEKILRLYARGDFTTQEIADAVGCMQEYVRVVARQRKGTQPSETDQKYLARVRARGDGKAAREAARRAYKKARQAGVNSSEASSISSREHGKVMRRTAKQAEASHA